MNSKYILTFYVLVGLFSVRKVKGHKCYVCGDEGEVSCKNFEINKSIFVRECSSTNKACLLKIEGKKRVRTCEQERIEDCKLANGVKYCFCTTDLCNDDETRFIIPTDDEDMLEGSGVKMVSTFTENPNTWDNTSSAWIANSISITMLFLLPLLVRMA